MDAEILSKPPISGDYEEHDFSTSNSTLWVKFLDKEYLEWVGIFSLSGWTSFSTVLRVPDRELFLIIADGQGYFVDPNTRKIVATTDWDGIADITYNDASGYFVVTDGLCLGLYQGHELIWSGERVSIDGIAFTGQSGTTIKGILNDLSDDGCEFSFEVISREFKSFWNFSDNWN